MPATVAASVTLVFIIAVTLVGWLVNTMAGTVTFATALVTAPKSLVTTTE